MTAQPPTLAHEIEAVAWAASHVEAMAKAARMRTGEVEEMRRRLEAALERLRTWEFGSAIAR